MADEQKPEERQLLFTLFTRDNPNGDSFIYEGFGPSKRRIRGLYEPAKDSSGKWNLVFPDDIDYNRGIPMPNPDTHLCSFTMPLRNADFDLMERARAAQNGNTWNDAVKNYLTAWNRPLANEVPFKVKLNKMPKLFYVHQRGSDDGRAIGNNDCFPLEKLGAGLVHGTFHPTQLASPWEWAKGKIGMRLSGGFLSPDNARGNYTAQQSMGCIYISLPFASQLLGEMQRADLKTTNDWFPHGSEFPRTHFIDYVFAQHCPDKERAPCPGIRIELNPKDPAKTTMAREKAWAKRYTEIHNLTLALRRNQELDYHPRPIRGFGPMEEEYY